MKRVDASVRHAARLTGAVEAMVYAAVFAVAMALCAALLGASAAQAHEAQVLERAVQLAGEAAERFAADPAAAPAVLEADGLSVACSVERDPRPFGFLYEAAITVREGDRVVCEQEACRYVSAREGGGS